MGDNPPQSVTSRFPQAGGNPIIEVIKVFSDFTKGAEDMKTPLPMTM